MVTIFLHALPTHDLFLKILAKFQKYHLRMGEHGILILLNIPRGYLTLNYKTDIVSSAIDTKSVLDTGFCVTIN